MSLEKYVQLEIEKWGNKSAFCGTNLFFGTQIFLVSQNGAVKDLV